MATLLLIDDDEDLRTVVALMLSSFGHKVIEATDGAHGLKLARNPAIDGVITDIVMPETNGIEVLIELKRLRPELKVIVISGGGRIGALYYLEMAKHLGANKLLTKPFSSKELIAAVRELWPGDASAPAPGATDDES